METRAYHVLIGLFTVVAAAGALLFALWMGKSGMERDYAYYEVGFNRAVSGLSVGNAVLYSGVKVGDVVDLRLDPEDPRHVRARIRVYADIPVKRDTRASLQLANITGSMNIQLHGGTPESPRLVGGPQHPPLIEADPSPLSALLDDGENLAKNLNTLLASIGRLLSEENIDRVGRILANLDLTTETLAARRDQLAETLARLNRAGGQAEVLMQELTRLSRQTGGLLDVQGRKTLEGAAQAMAAIKDAAVRLEGMMSANQDALNQSLRGLGDLEPAVRELNTILGNLSRITRRLEDNPADFLLGRDAIQEFAP
jgi:phospholipid/cholesterol/gamma-HCH transport system substrate-binding protein